MTETDTYHAQLPDVLRPMEALVSGNVQAFDVWVSGLSYEDLEEVGAAFSHMSKINSIAGGKIAYEIRARTPDGDWGREVKKLAMSWEVSDRTIHRWMSAAQEHFGFELTPAQSNARAVADRPSVSTNDQNGESDAWTWDDDEGEAEAAGFWESAPEDNAAYMRDLVGEPDNPAPPTPSTRYENPPDAPPAGRAVIPPDEVWVSFTSSQIAAEHPEYGGQALERMARARWDRMSTQQPLDLLEDLEQIHGAGGVEDSLASALLAAEEAKALKPEVVDPGSGKPKKPRKAGSGASAGKVAKLPDPQAGFRNVEVGMEYTRELHSHVAQLLEEGGADMAMRVYGGAIDNLASWHFTLGGVLKKLRKAREDSKRGAAQAAPEGEDF